MMSHRNNTNNTIVQQDGYQKRYLSHQKRKINSLLSNYGTTEFRRYNKNEQNVFFEILKTRSSQRCFNDEEVGMEPILKAIELSPSSCDRKGVLIKVLESREQKEILSGLLVGGVGWIYRANKILLLLANMNCYKNPIEQYNMPYLDAGVIIQTVYLTCESLNYGCCYVNPNIRQENIEFFKNSFSLSDNILFCGALAIGKYDKKHKKYE